MFRHPAPVVRRCAIVGMLPKGHGSFVALASSSKASQESLSGDRAQRGISLLRRRAEIGKLMGRTSFPRSLRWLPGTQRNGRPVHLRRAICYPGIAAAAGLRPVRRITGCCASSAALHGGISSGARRPGKLVEPQRRIPFAGQSPVAIFPYLLCPSISVLVQVSRVRYQSAVCRNVKSIVQLTRCLPLGEHGVKLLACQKTVFLTAFLLLHHAAGA